MFRTQFVAFPLLCCMFTLVPIAGADAISKASLEVNSAMRQDNLRWNTGISELEWDELDIYEIGGNARLIVENSVMPFATCIRIQGTYGEIYAGNVRDSDYTSQGEYSRSISDSDDGETLSLNGGIGPQFTFWGNRISLAALVGYHYREQNLTMRDGLQLISGSLKTPAAGTYMPELDSSYDATWEGVWAGVDASLSLGKRLIVKAEVEVQDIKYEAEATWNLRTDLAQPLSFAHDADGSGIMSSVAMQFLLTESWALSGKINYAYMLSEDGTHTVYGSDGSVTRIPLNEVEWESIGATLGLCWTF